MPPLLREENQITRRRSEIGGGSSGQSMHGGGDYWWKLGELSAVGQGANAISPWKYRKIPRERPTPEMVSKINKKHLVCRLW